jgi:hypothetical protein
MAGHLPPDLERLGVTLTEATARAAAVRRHQIKLVRWLAACVAAGVFVFAATPAHLGPATPPAGGLFGVEAAHGSMHRGPCDPPHGAATGCHDADPPPQAR